jgi:hypothetical protein
VLARRSELTQEDYPIEREMADELFLDLGSDSDEDHCFIYANPYSFSGGSFDSILEEATSAPLNCSFDSATDEAQA